MKQSPLLQRLGTQKTKAGGTGVAKQTGMCNNSSCDNHSNNDDDNNNRNENTSRSSSGSSSHSTKKHEQPKQHLLARHLPRLKDRQANGQTPVQVYMQTDRRTDGWAEMRT